MPGRCHAAGAEPQLPLLFVDLDHVAHRPRALGDLVLHRAGRAVDQVEVVPAVALRHPDDFLAVGEVVAIALAGLQRRGAAVVIEERLRLFGDHRARGAGVRVDFDDAIHLVAALVVFEREAAAVLAPHQVGQVVRIREQPRVDRRSASGCARRTAPAARGRAGRRAWRTAPPSVRAAADLPATRRRSARGADSPGRTR